MKQNPKLQNIQEKMQPGVLTSHGFLGEDTRNIIDIILQDKSVVENLGLSHKIIADRMRYFTQKGISDFGNPVTVDSIFEAVVEDYMGAIPCPFSDNHKIEKRNTRVTNLLTNRSVRWTDLNIHMIENHGFYEGMGSYFRIEPKKIAEVLVIARVI